MTTPDDGWAAISGTSAAAPQLAGVAALVRQACPRLDPRAVRDLMVRTAVDVSAGRCFNRPGMNHAATAGRDLATGTGLVNADRAALLAQLRCLLRPSRPLASTPLDARAATSDLPGAAEGVPMTEQDAEQLENLLLELGPDAAGVRPSTPPGPHGFMMSPWRPSRVGPRRPAAQRRGRRRRPAGHGCGHPPPRRDARRVETLTAWFRDHGARDGAGGRHLVRRERLRRGLRRAVAVDRHDRTCRSRPRPPCRLTRCRTPSRGGWTPWCSRPHRTSARRAPDRGPGPECQWLESCPVSRSCMLPLALFRPRMRTVLPRRAYLWVTASSAATDEASHTWDSERSMTTRSGSCA